MPVPNNTSIIYVFYFEQAWDWMHNCIFSNTTKSYTESKLTSDKISPKTAESNIFQFKTMCTVKL